MSEPYRYSADLLSQIYHVSKAYCRRICRPEKTIRLMEIYKCYKMIRKNNGMKMHNSGCISSLLLGEEEGHPGVLKHCNVLVLKLGGRHIQVYYL